MILIFINIVVGGGGGFVRICEYFSKIFFSCVPSDLSMIVGPNLPKTDTFTARILGWALENSDQGNITYNTDLAQYIYSYAGIKVILQIGLGVTPNFVKKT